MFPIYNPGSTVVMYGAAPYSPQPSDPDWVKRLREGIAPYVPVEQPNPAALLPKAEPVVVNATDDQKRAFAAAVLSELYVRVMGIADGRAVTKRTRELVKLIGIEISKLGGAVALGEWPGRKA